MIRDNSDARPNVDEATVAGFGDEWSRFDQTGLSSASSEKIFQDYFQIFPWKVLAADSRGADIGCGSGRWAEHVAPRVGLLYAIDASPAALAVAQKKLGAFDNIIARVASVNAMPIENASLDFAYSLGVLHHVPDTKGALLALATKLKPGAPFLVYLYYAFDDRGPMFKALWRVSDIFRQGISRMPSGMRFAASQAIALFVYWPLARSTTLIQRLGFRSLALPLSYYADKPFYVLRTDALDRFGTRLEQRFTKLEIRTMLEDAGFRDIVFSSNPPYWVALGYKR